MDRLRSWLPKNKKLVQPAPPTPPEPPESGYSLDFSDANNSMYINVMM